MLNHIQRPERSRQTLAGQPGAPAGGNKRPAGRQTSTLKIGKIVGWWKLKATNVRASWNSPEQKSSSPNTWLFEQVDNPSLSARSRSVSGLTDPWSGVTCQMERSGGREDWKGHRGGSRQLFSTCQWGRTMIEHTQTRMYIHAGDGEQTTNKPTSAQTHIRLFLSPPCSGLPFFLILSAYRHTQTRTHTRPLRWGNWMWQKSLGGLFGGYRVNLWNGTQLTPAGWFWHPHQTSLSHYSNHWGLNTASSCTSAPDPCKATPGWRRKCFRNFPALSSDSTNATKLQSKPVFFLDFTASDDSCAHDTHTNTYTHLLPYALTHSHRLHSVAL